jgi:ribosomal protein S18 acetylase RimI-like enzyme
MLAVNARPATPDDVVYLTELRMRTIHEHICNAGTVLTLEEHQRRASSNLESCTVLEAAGKRIGMMKVLKSTGEWNLDQFQLDPEVQGQGVGSALVKQLQASARVAGVSLTLSVLQVNPAVRLYERLGFRIVREEPGIYAMQSEA